MPGYIEKRGEDSYRLVVSSGYGTGGKRKKYTKTIKVNGKTEPERKRKCEKELAKFIAKIESNSFIEPSKLTLKEFTEKWLKDYAEKNLAPKTIFRYKQMLDSRIFPALGHIKIIKLKPINFIEFYNNLTEDGIREDGKPGGLSPQTIRHHHRLLHTILEHAVKWQMLSSNPTDNVDPPKVKKVEASFYDEDEVKKLIAVLELIDKRNFKYKVAILLTLSSGLRLGELAGLKWDNVNFEKQTISIVQSNQYLPKLGTFTKDPKNNTSIRTLYIPENVINLLSKYKSEQKKIELACGDRWINSGFIFTQWNGKPMYPGTPSKWFSKFLRKNNLKPITFHQLRHTSASLLINENINIREISKRLGHSNTSTTLNIYSHALKSADKDAADKLNTIIFSNDSINNKD